MNFEWTDGYLVGVSEMDDTHREFVNLVDDLLQSTADEFRTKFLELLEHTRAHFRHESKLMRDSGFPPTQIHEEEHERVLNAFELAESKLQSNDPAPAMELVRQLPNWFSLHAATMDRALGFHLQQSHPQAVAFSTS